MAFYSVSQYSGNTFKTVRYSRPPIRGFSSGVAKEDRSNDEKLSQSVSRAKKTIIELALCNEWEYFITLTVSSDNFDRYDLFPIVHTLTQWFRDQRKQLGYEKLAYCLVPERHEKGGWHFHGFISGVPSWALSPFVRGLHPSDLCDGNYLNWCDLSVKIGFCSLDPIRDQVRTAFYCSKYFTKNQVRNVTEVGSHMYYCSRGLLRAVPVGWCYESNRLFDNSIEIKTPFCDVGWLFNADPLLVISNLDDVNADSLFPVEEEEEDLENINPYYEQICFDQIFLDRFRSPYGGVV